MRQGNPLGVRWTIGNVSERGFEALQLSLWGAWRIFGAAAQYQVCVNSVPLERARALTGDVPPAVTWYLADRDLPPFLARHLDAGMAEGVGWKFAPLRCFPDAHELSLDNDCILWDLPSALREWLADRGPSFAIAEDVRASFGAFAPLCPQEPPRNSGIRGLPPGFDLHRALEALLREHPVPLTSELDEQGMQVALLLRSGTVRTVSLEEVTLCSPFPPHRDHLGRCGVHFVGLNARHLPWRLNGRPAEELIAENWQRLRGAVQALVFAPREAGAARGRAGDKPPAAPAS